MSATADAELFSSYMQQNTLGGPPRVDPRGKASLPPPPPMLAGAHAVGMLTIPGFTYPVREFYLEDILEMTGHIIGRGSR